MVFFVYQGVIKTDMQSQSGVLHGNGTAARQADTFAKISSWFLILFECSYGPQTDRSAKTGLTSIH